MARQRHLANGGCAQNAAVRRVQRLAIQQEQRHAGLVVDNVIDGRRDAQQVLAPDPSDRLELPMRAGHPVGPKGILAVTDTPYSPAYFGIGVPENDSDWRDAVNYGLHDLWNTGDFHTIHEKWFGEKSMCPIPRGENRMEPFVEG